MPETAEGIAVHPDDPDLASLAADGRVVAYFGYGSLVGVPGRGRVGRLHGWRRGWGVAMDNAVTVPGYKVYVAPDGSRPDVCVAFLDIAEAAAGDLAAIVAGGALPHEVASALVRELDDGSEPILVVEDVHWADEATLDVLRLLFGRLAGLPALVVVTYRDDELERTHPLRMLLGDLARASKPTLPSMVIGPSLAFSSMLMPRCLALGETA